MTDTEGYLAKPSDTQAAVPDKEQYLAKPSGDCCLKGTLHEGEPRGKIETVAGIETYVSQPQGKSNGNILLYFPDVWGFFNNGFLVMDGFADAGYLTIGLDYFRGVGYTARYTRCVTLAEVKDRTPFRNTERIETILLRDSTTKLGRRNIPNLRTRMCRDGWKL